MSTSTLSGELTIERENDTIHIYVKKSYTKTLVWEGSIAEWSHAIAKASIRTVIITAPAEPQPA